MKIIHTGMHEWENRHETFKEKIKDLYIAANEPALDALEGYNDSTRGFQRAIAEAIQTHSPLRALGAGWSWSKIASARDGVIMDTKALNTTMRISAQSVAPKYAGDAAKLIFAQCGNAVWELGRDLFPLGLSLKTCGASNGQTIVGAMSTGAHGSSLDVGAVQDYIVGMHLIVGPDRHIWLERKSAPVVSASFIKKLETILVKDDDLFNAALVSFGSFGIIHGVLIETEDLFLLEAYMQRLPFDDTLKGLMETLDFSKATLPCGNERPFHFEVTINPYDLKNGAYVYTFYKRAYRPDYVRPVRRGDGIGPGDDAPCFIGKLTGLTPALVPTLVNKLLAGTLKPFRKKIGTLSEIFNNTSLHGKLYSASIGIPLSRVIHVTELLLELNKKEGPFAGLFAYRYIKKSKATLAFTRFEYTCIFELDGAFSEATKKFYTAVWFRLEEENIPFTFHWGKMNEMDPGRISRMYGKDAEAWMAARNKLLDADSIQVFTNPLLREWGLGKIK